MEGKVYGMLDALLEQHSYLPVRPGAHSEEWGVWSFKEFGVII